MMEKREGSVYGLIGACWPGEAESGPAGIRASQGIRLPLVGPNLEVGTRTREAGS